MAKDTIYIEPDDEITVVIDKVLSSKQKIVALVLPKRASVFHSAVNMKLLKKAAAEEKKSIVLITSDKTMEAIAASAAVHMANSLNSKPYLPKAIKKKEEVAIAASVAELPKNDGDPESSPEPDTEEVADQTDDDEVTLDDKEAEKVDKKSKKRFKIPDFKKFQVRLALGILLFILLVTGWVFGFIIMPKAEVTINTNTARTELTEQFTARAGAQTDIEAGILSAQKAEISKENRVALPATGQKDIGEKASGIVTVTNCNNGSSVTIPAGSSFSASGKTFVSTESITLAPGYVVGGDCRSDELPPSFEAYGDVSVVAASAGESFNISAQSHTTSASGVTAFGSAMTGGTTEVVTVVSAEDIQKAKDQLGGAANAEAIGELRTQLENDNKQALNETLVSSEPKQVISAQVDDQVEEVAITQTVTFSMLGIDREDLESFVNNRVDKKLEDSTKTVRSNGLDDGVYRLVSQNSPDDQTISFQTIFVTGPIFDEQQLKEEIAGKRRGEIESMLEAKDGVRSVNVDYSPAWVTTTPKSAHKISIVVNEVSE